MRCHAGESANRQAVARGIASGAPVAFLLPAATGDPIAPTQSTPVRRNLTTTPPCRGRTSWEAAVQASATVLTAGALYGAGLARADVRLACTLLGIDPAVCI